MPTKIKATEISFNGMTGLCMRVITFHDFEQKIYTVGRERTKKQYRSFDGKVFFKDHLDVKTLDDKRFHHTADSKTRMFPPQKNDLELDLKVWKEIKDKPKILDFDLEKILLEEIEKAKY